MNTLIDPDLLEYLRKQSNNKVIKEKELSKIRDNMNVDLKKYCDSPFPLVSVNDVFIPVKNDKIRIRIYNPLKDQILPVLIFIHGGGWFAGNIETHDVFCRKIAKYTKCIVVSVNYRLAPEYKYPYALEDCCEACLWVKNNINNYFGNPSNIAVCGDSSGGNLVSAISQIALNRQLPVFKFQFLIFPVMNLSYLNTKLYQLFGEGFGLTKKDMKWFIKMYLNNSQEACHPLVSPLLSNDFSMVPDTYIITAGYDILKDESIAYAEKLKAANIFVFEKCYQDMIHGFIVKDGVSNRVKKIIIEISEIINLAFKERKKKNFL